MARLKHIAIATRNPAESAKFFIEVMGMTVTQVGVGDNPNYFLSDDAGIELALVNLQPHGVMGLERPADFEGLHHVGFEVSDVEATAKQLEQTPYKRRWDIENAIKERNEARATSGVKVAPRPGGQEVKYWGPAGITFDLMAKHGD